MTAESAAETRPPGWRSPRWREWLPLLAVVAFAAAFAAVHATYAIRRHEAYASRGDTACLEQMVRRTAEGRLFEAPYCWSVHVYYSVLGGDPRSGLPDDATYLGLHASLLALPLALLYLAVPGVPVLLVAAAVSVSAGAPLLYLLARQRTGSILLGLGFAAAYLLHPVTGGAIVGEFHPDQFFVPLFLGSVTAFAFGRNRLFLLLAALALFVKEGAAPILAGLAIFALLSRPREWQFGVALLLIVAVWWVAVFRLAIPNESLYGHYLFESLYGNRLGGNFSQIFTTALTQPRLLAETLNTHANGQYVFDLHAPYLFLALLSPLTYLAQAAAQFASLISSSPALKLMWHYAIMPMPVVAWASVETVALIRAGFARLGRRSARVAGLRRYGVLLAAVVAVAMPLAAYGRDDRAQFSLTRERDREAFQATQFGSVTGVLACLREEDYLATIDQLAAHSAAERVTWPGVALEETTVIIVPTIDGFAVTPDLARDLQARLAGSFASFRMEDPLKMLVMVRHGSPSEGCIGEAVAAYRAGSAGP